jgi:protein TonB
MADRGVAVDLTGKSREDEESARSLEGLRRLSAVSHPVGSAGGFAISAQHPRARRLTSATIVSVACHAALLALLLVSATQATLKKPQPSTLCCVAELQVAGGSRALHLPPPEVAVAKANHSTKHSPAQEPVTRSPSTPRERRIAKASGTNAIAAHPLDLGSNSVAGNGGDAQNTTIAFPVFYPNPAVRDRSLLPASEKQVIIDVQLNAGGDVVGENLVKGIGNALDQMALDSVKIWRFQPATVNGKPVESEAEVIFSFSQRYPSSDS